MMPRCVISNYERNTNDQLLRIRDALLHARLPSHHLTLCTGQSPASLILLLIHQGPFQVLYEHASIAKENLKQHFA